MADAATEGVKLVRKWEPENSDVSSYIEHYLIFLQTVTVPITVSHMVLDNCAFESCHLCICSQAWLRPTLHHDPPPNGSESPNMKNGAPVLEPKIALTSGLHIGKDVACFQVHLVLVKEKENLKNLGPG